MDATVEQGTQNDQVSESALAEVAPRPVRKRAKTAHSATSQEPKKKRGKRRTLSQLTDMPLDVVFEIFTHLFPADLLNLARSTKAFRELLMKKSSITIWRAARGNVLDLPDCPPDLSEPAYANLLFSNCCHYCGKQGIQTIEWILLARCCKTCRENPRLFFDATSTEQRHSRDWLKNYFPSIVRGKSVYIRLAEIIPFLEECGNVEEDDQAFIGSLRRNAERMLRRKMDVAPYQAWDEARFRNRELELDELRDQRRTAVWEKLSELGLGEERNKMISHDRESLEQMEGMKEPALLTDRAWSKAKDKIITFVQSARTERLRKERSAPYQAVIRAFTVQLDEYSLTRPLDDVHPSTFEVCMSSQIRPLIDDFVNAGPSATPDTARFAELIPEVCSEWENTTSARIAELLPPWLRAEDGPGLQSALVWFACHHKSDYGTSCRDTSIAYPRIMGHSHTRKYHSLRHVPETAEDDLINAAHETWPLVLGGFSPEVMEKNIKFDLHASVAACEIVTLCGLDPTTATYSDMDALDRRIACVPCKQVMTWRKAVSHIYKQKHKGQRSWELLNKQDEAALKKLEAKDRPKSTTGRFNCMRCRKFERSKWSCMHSCKGLKAFKTHLETRHGIVQFRPKIGVDYYVPEGEPTSDEARPLPVARKDLDFKVSTPALVKEGW